MQTPLQLEVEGLDPSLHLREIIDENIAKLERRFGRITAARVAVRAPNAHHKPGEPFFVSIWLSLPDRGEVSVKPTGQALDRRQGDVVFAVGDAFRRADRQLSDYAAKLKKRPRPGNGRLAPEQ
jgi:hypothetical protein